MVKRKIEFYVGLFVLVGIICSGYLFIVLGEINFVKSDQYSIFGNFTSVSGLKVGARVELAGVSIGTVSDIHIDKEELLARVEFSIDKDIELTDDIIASVKTAGIIGQKYISISPGGSDTILEDGDDIYNTESALDLESIVRKVIFTKDNKE